MTTSAPSRLDPRAPQTVADLEPQARACLDPATWAYLAGGAGTDAGVAANLEAFRRTYLRPRVALTDVSNPVLRTQVLGSTIELPVLLAPTSPQRLVHLDAELATARAAAACGTISIVSNDSHHAFDAVSRSAPGSCWFQLYCYRSWHDVEATIAMVEHQGAGALVVTTDASFAARRITAERARFRMPPGVDFGTLRALGVLTDAVPTGGRLERLPVSWQALEFIRSRTTIPLVVKGILDGQDARRCVDLGADAVVVSNHGGRQLDHVLPSLMALPEVASAVAGRAAVLVDGGVRSGSDVLMALALGADAACIGRPYLWGLAVGGQAGVERVLSILRQEIGDGLRQLGIGAVTEVDGRCVVPAGTAVPTPSRTTSEGGP